MTLLLIWEGINYLIILDIKEYADKFDILRCQVCQN